MFFVCHLDTLVNLASFVLICFKVRTHQFQGKLFVGLWQTVIWGVHILSGHSVEVRRWLYTNQVDGGVA